MARASGHRNPGAALARRLREERLRAGLSSRELAARAGISHVTAAAAERGRGVRASTLARLLDALPGLRPHEVLGGEPSTSPASAGEWEALARLFGFEASLVTLDARIDAHGRMTSELAVLGLRATRGSLSDRARLVSVVGAPLQGAALELASRVSEHPRPAGRTHALVIDGVEHAVSIPRRLDGAALRYVRRDFGAGPLVEAALPEQSPHGRPFVKGACAWIDHPVRRLVLRARFADGTAPRFARILAWPATLATAPGEDVDTWHRLYPHEPRCVAIAGGCAELTLELPPAGTCFALAWDQPEPGGARAWPAAQRPEPPSRPRPHLPATQPCPEQEARPNVCAVRSEARGDGASGLRTSTSPVTARPLQARPLGAALRAAREQAGLSRRQAASLMGVSIASVVEAERGRDARLDMLSRAVERIPGLCAAELFPPRNDATAPSIDAIRERQALVYGVRTAAERSVVRIAKNGDVAVESRREGLRPLEPESRRFRLRIGPTRGPQTARRWDVESIAARGGEGEATVRVVGRGAGPTVHELRFLASSERRPITHVRRMTVRAQVATRPDAPHATRDARGRRAEAVYVEPALPTDLASLELRFPPGYWPDEIVASAVPRACGPCFQPEDLAPLAHPDGFRLSVDRARRRVLLEVERPLVGLRYQVLWFLD